MATRRLYGWNEEARKRIDRGECPVCGKPKREWKRRKDWSCCSIECSKRIGEAYDLWSRTRDMVIERDRVCRICGGVPHGTVDLAAINVNGLGITVDQAIYGNRLDGYDTNAIVDRDVIFCVSELISSKIIFKPHRIGFNVFHNGSQLFKLGEVYHWYENRPTYPDYHNRVKAVKDCDKIPFYHIEYIDDTRWIVDHMLPIAMGGPEFDTDNLQLLCDRCNKLKTREDLAWIARYKRAGSKERQHQIVESYLRHGPMANGRLAQSKLLI